MIKKLKREKHDELTSEKKVVSTLLANNDFLASESGVDNQDQVI